MKWICIFWAAMIATANPARAARLLPGPYEAQVLRVIDGNTVELRIKAWLDLEVVTHVRLRDIDAPQLHGHGPGEREAAEKARDYLINLLGDAPVTLTLISLDKYGGRIDARMQLPTGEDASSSMLAAGHAVRSHGSRAPRC